MSAEWGRCHLDECRITGREQPTDQAPYTSLARPTARTWRRRRTGCSPTPGPWTLREDVRGERRRSLSKLRLRKLDLDISSQTGKMKLPSPGQRGLESSVPLERSQWPRTRELSKRRQVILFT